MLLQTETNTVDAGGVVIFTGTIDPSVCAGRVLGASMLAVEQIVLDCDAGTVVVHARVDPTAIGCASVAIEFVDRDGVRWDRGCGAIAVAAALGIAARVETTLVESTYTVVVHVMNGSDVAAHGVRVRWDVPAGVIAESDEVTIESLAPGARTIVAQPMRVDIGERRQIVVPRVEIGLADGRTLEAFGEPCALERCGRIIIDAIDAPSSALVDEPTHVVVHLRNPGTVAVPRSKLWLRTDAHITGSRRGRGDERSIVVPEIGPGAHRELVVAVRAPAVGECPIAAWLDEAGADTVHQTLRVRGRSVVHAASSRIDIARMTVDAGGAIDGSIVLTNEGAQDLASIGVDLDIEAVGFQRLAAGPLAKGASVRVPFSARAPSSIADGTSLAIRAIARALGVDIELASRSITVRSRGVLRATASVERTTIEPGGSVCVGVLLANVGSDALPALDLLVDGMHGFAIECVGTAPPLRPGESAQLRVSLQAIDVAPGLHVCSLRVGSHERGWIDLNPCPIYVACEPRIDIAFTAPREALAPGQTATFEARVTNVGDAIATRVNLHLEATACSYVAGSMRINDIAVIDARGSNALWTGEGLTIEHLAIGAQCAVRWEMIAETAPTVSVAATAWYDAQCVRAQSPPVAVKAADPSTARLPFGLHGVALGLASHTVPPAPHAASPALSPALEAAEAPDARAAHDTNGADVHDTHDATDTNDTHVAKNAHDAHDAYGGEVAAVPMPLGPAMSHFLRAQPGLFRHLYTVGLALDDDAYEPVRSIFDRLSIKLRLPHFGIDDRDVLDAPARACAGEASQASLSVALTVLVERAHLASAYREALVRHLRGLDDLAVIAALTQAHDALDAMLDRSLEARAPS